MEDNKLPGLGRAGLQASIDRRRLLQVAAALGLTTTVAGRMGIGTAFGADFDMKKYAGTKLSILMTGDENDHRALADLLPQFDRGDRHGAGDHLAGARRR